MANERIKTDAKATTDAVGKVLKEVATTVKKGVKQKIYVGPSLPGLTKYTVVESLEVPYVKALVKEREILKKLFVPITRLADFEKRAQLKGTLEHRYYNQATQKTEKKEEQ